MELAAIFGVVWTMFVILFIFSNNLGGFTNLEQRQLTVLLPLTLDPLLVTVLWIRNYFFRIRIPFSAKFWIRIKKNSYGSGSY
jgi:hypothetical protein